MQTLRVNLKQSRKETINIKRSDAVSSKPVETSLDSVLSHGAFVLRESEASSVTGKNSECPM
jgi:hypothetical protein